MTDATTLQKNYGQVVPAITAPIIASPIVTQAPVTPPPPTTPTPGSTPTDPTNNSGTSPIDSDEKTHSKHPRSLPRGKRD